MISLTDVKVLKRTSLSYLNQSYLGLFCVLSWRLVYCGWLCLHHLRRRRMLTRMLLYRDVPLLTCLRRRIVSLLSRLRRRIVSLLSRLRRRIVALLLLLGWILSRRYVLLLLLSVVVLVLLRRNLLRWWLLGMGVLWRILVAMTGFRLSFQKWTIDALDEFFPWIHIQ